VRCHIALGRPAPASELYAKAKLRLTYRRINLRKGALESEEYQRARSGLHQCDWRSASFSSVQSRNQELVANIRLCIVTYPGVPTMSPTHRFGKRLPLPSTRQIRHELILMWAEDELKKREARAITPETTVRNSENAKAPPS
jgi:hypothetical protein